MTEETNTAAAPAKKKKGFWWWVWCSLFVAIAIPFVGALVVWVLLLFAPSPPPEVYADWPECPLREDGANIGYFNFGKATLGIPRELLEYVRFTEDHQYSWNIARTLLGCGRPDLPPEKMRFYTSLKNNKLISYGSDGILPPMAPLFPCNKVEDCSKVIFFEIYPIDKLPFEPRNTRKDPRLKDDRVCPAPSSITPKEFETKDQNFRVTLHTNPKIQCNCFAGYKNLPDGGIDKDFGLLMICENTLLFDALGIGVQYTYYTQPTIAEDIVSVEKIIEKMIEQSYEDGKYSFVIPPLKRKQP